MVPNDIRIAVKAALALLPPELNTQSSNVAIFAIGLQESRLKERRQLVGNPPKPIGPAKGAWQFERGGGCKGVVTHQASRYWMSKVCEQRHTAFNATAIWNAIEHDDVLAAAAARLLLFTDPKKLPVPGDERGCWNLYIRTWRPGKPHPDTWARMYAAALSEVMGYP